VLSDIRYYSSPLRVSDAVNELKKGKGKWAVFAGGTSAVLGRMGNVSGFISLKNCGLDHITQSRTELSIGSMARIQDILENKAAQKFAKGLLYKASYRIGSTLNRNLITLGGNIIQIYRWSDLPVALLVLDSKVNVKGPASRTLKFSDLLKKHPKTVLKYTDIVTEVRIKSPSGVFGTEFITFSKTEFDYALCNVAVFIQMNEKKCKDIRIAFGALQPLPFRAYKLEKMMKNKVIIDELIREVAEEASKSTEVSSDFRASREYKKHLIRVLLERAIKGAMKSA